MCLLWSNTHIGWFIVIFLDNFSLERRNNFIITCRHFDDSSGGSLTLDFHTQTEKSRNCQELQIFSNLHPTKLENNIPADDNMTYNKTTGWPVTRYNIIRNYQSKQCINHMILWQLLTVTVHPVFSNDILVTITKHCFTSPSLIKLFPRHISRPV